MIGQGRGRAEKGDGEGGQKQQKRKWDKEIGGDTSYFLNHC